MPLQQDALGSLLFKERDNSIRFKQGANDLLFEELKLRPLPISSLITSTLEWHIEVTRKGFTLAFSAAEWSAVLLRCPLLSNTAPSYSSEMDNSGLLMHPLEAKAVGRPGFQLQLPGEEVDLPHCCPPQHLLLPRAAAAPPQGLRPGLRSARVCSRSRPALGELVASPGTPPSLFCCGELLDGELSQTFFPSSSSFHYKEKRPSYLFIDNLWIICPSFYEVALIIEVTECELHPVRHLDTN